MIQTPIAPSMLYAITNILKVYWEEKPTQVGIESQIQIFEYGTSLFFIFLLKNYKAIVKFIIIEHFVES